MRNSLSEIKFHTATGQYCFYYQKKRHYFGRDKRKANERFRPAVAAAIAASKAKKGEGPALLTGKQHTVAVALNQCLQIGAAHNQPATFRRIQRAILVTCEKRTVDRVLAMRQQAGEKPIIPWTPYQLRHLRAQQIRDKWGPEVAREVLGHSAGLIDTYSGASIGRAVEVAAKVG